MAKGQLTRVVQHLRDVLAKHDAADITDGDLLKRYVQHRDEAAFRALVQRHGPMVLGVCRRVLHNQHDAEDAFQATFLVLVRKAPTLRSPGMIGNWLYGVAYRTALHARGATSKRRVKEAEVKPPTETPVDAWADMRQVLDEELNRLPEKYRVVIVLCDLEGKTRKEAAQHLDWAEGTVASRLARGRVMLAKRLATHGLCISAGALAAALSQNVTSACMSPSLLGCTIKAAGAFTVGSAATGGVISAKVAALTEGVLKTMLLTKLKVVTAVLCTVMVLAAGAAFAWFPEPPRGRVQADQPAKSDGAKKAAAEAKTVVVQEDAQVRTVAWHANGKILATIGIVYESVEFRDGGGQLTDSGGVVPHSTIKLWDATTGELKRSLGEEKDTYIAAIAFSADGKTAAISTSKHVLTNQPKNPIRFETEIRVMDAQTWALKHKVKCFASALAFSPDGTSLALGGNSGDKAFVRLWDVQKQKMMGGTEGGGYRVHCLAFSIDGKQLATGDENGKVRLFDGRTGAAPRDFEGHGPLRSGGEQCVIGIGFSPDGKTLVSGSQDKTLKLWGVEKGELLRNLEGNKARVSALAFSPDGKLFATAGSTADSAVRGPFEVLLWDMKTGQPKETFPEQSLPVNSLAFSPDGSTLAIGAGAGFNSAVNTETGRAKTPGEFKLWKLNLPEAKSTEKKDQENETAWGKEVGGLQAGLGFRPGERRAYHHGETVTLVVRVRNVGKEAVKFNYIRQFLDENPPTVTDADGKTVPLPRFDVLGGHPPVEVSLEPGKETELESRLAGGARLAGASGLKLPLFVGMGTGKVSVQYGRVLGNSSAGSIKVDPTLNKLATGKLELEIKPAAKDDPASGLVRKLGDPAFKTREDATKKLRDLGVKAIPALQAGTRDPSAEVRKRSQEVLAAIRADARDALVKQFDSKKTEEYDHPVWKHFVAIAGDSKASRELFARIIANEKWLRTLDNAEADPPAAGHVYRVGIAEVFRDFHNDPAKSPAWPCDRPEEVAYLLLLGSHPDNNPPAKLTGDEIVPPNLRGVAFLGRGIIFGEGQITHANGLSLGLDGKIRFFNAPEIVGAVGTDRVFAKLFAAWLVRRDPASEVVPRGFLIASGRRVPELLPLARRYAANDFEPKREVPPLATIAALELVAQIGTRADLPLFERHFGDETNVAAVDKPRTDGASDYYRPAPLTETTQLRDVALGLALLLHGASPEDFGFVVRKDTFKQKDGRYTIPWSTQLHLGFESDANRTAAFKKAKAWLAEQKPKAEPPAALKRGPEPE